MAGHSKWANTKRRKAAQDSARGKLFTKLIKEIMVAAKVGGSDVDANPRLRLAIDKAKANSAPKASIERAILKGAGELQGDNYEDLVYEGYGPGGAAILVECLTDNRNRTASEVRAAFTKEGGNLGATGSVSYLFQTQGVFTLANNHLDEDTIITVALEAGADDVAFDDPAWVVRCEPNDYDACKAALSTLDAELTAELTKVPDTYVSLSTDDAKRVLRLLDRLSACDDVQDTHTNADIPETI